MPGQATITIERHEDELVDAATGNLVMMRRSMIAVLPLPIP